MTKRIAYDEPCLCKCGNRFCASNRSSLTNRSGTEDGQVVAKRRGANHKKAKERERVVQAATSQSAERRYQQWTGPELDLLTRTDLTARTIAEMTGRTYYAVMTMRKRLSREPKLQRVVDPFNNRVD